MARMPQQSDSECTVTVTITDNADTSKTKTWTFDRVHALDEAVDTADDGSVRASFVLQNRAPS